MHRFVLAAALVGLCACGNDKATGGQGDDGSNQPDDARPDDGPTIAGTNYSLTWGPITVAPHQENTQCVRLKLPNAVEIKVNQMHNVLGTTSHHLIVYRDDDPADAAEQPTPQDCQPFTGALNTTGNVFPMMITQKHDDLLTLPAGVAYTLAANQMIKIEMHFINTTDDPAQGTATINFVAAEASTIHDEANILFIGSPDINIAPNSMATVHEFFSPSNALLDLSQAKIFAMTGHTHKLGLDVTVGVGTSTTSSTPVYAPDPFQWSEPETTTYSPEFSVPNDQGFDFKCDYYNDTSATVKFGESANNEMCFFWAYYYPSNGSHVCIHANYGNGLDICCPSTSGIDKLICDCIPEFGLPQNQRTQECQALPGG